MPSKSSCTFAGIIPARYASSRFPGKPLALISGKTLLQRTYENALQFKQLNRIFVATDDIRIAEHVKSFGGQVVMTSSKCPTGTDRLAEVVRTSAELTNIDYIMNIQGDEPCVRPSVISAVSAAISENKECMMSTAVIPLKDLEEAKRPSVVKCVMDKNNFALYFSRSLIPVNQSGQPMTAECYYRHLGVYCYRRDFLLHYETLSSTPLQETEQLEMLKVLEHGYRIKVAIVNEDALSPAVDYPEDIQKVEQFLCSKNTSS